MARPKSSEYYVADFETTSYDTYLQTGSTSVWLWAICDSTPSAEVLSIGHTIDEFIEWCIEHVPNRIIYFHNLKFDGSFIIDYIAKQGYSYYEDLSKVKQGYSCLISDKGAWYSIDIRISSRITLHFHDSLKLLPFKVSKIAKDFGLPILKEELDYNCYLDTPHAREYISHDVRIVSMALQQLKAEGFSKMTTASSAYSYYQSVSPNFFSHNAFPDLDSSLLRSMRGAYRGGRSQVNPLYQNKIVHHVKRFDINSMYPYVMRSLPLPYGLPIQYVGRDKYIFEIMHVKIGFILKEGHLPSLLKKECSFTDSSYYIQTEDIEEMWISNLDLQLVERNYDVYYLEIISTYGFNTTTLLFKEYIDYWYPKKQSDVGAPKVCDKLMLNSLYGKFGTNIDKSHKIPDLDDDTIVFSNSKVEEGKKYYLPVAIAIVSWAHVLIDNAINYTGTENFVYCDTDSVHTLGELPMDLIDNTALGKFKLEAVEETARYVRQKTYITKENGSWHVTACGMPDNVKERFLAKAGDRAINEFTVGLKVGGKLMPKRVPGGTVLYETTFQIN